MQVAIVSDIHGNRHALEAVIDDAEANTDATEMWCLGDVVGYGADPNDCCALVREHARVCLAGNHDLAVTGAIELDEFSAGAALAARWTQEVLGDEHRTWLSGLEPKGASGGVGLYHASPRDPIWEYVLSVLLAELCLDAMPERLGFVGHSHVALAFHRPEGEPATGAACRGGDSADLALRRVADEPRQRRAAARRRRPRGLAAAGHHGAHGPVEAHAVRHRGRAGVDPRRPPA